MVDFADNYDELYRIKCELDEAIAKAYFDARMYPRRIAGVTGYTQSQIKEILTAVNPQALVNFGAPAASPLVMPHRKPRSRSKSGKLAWAMRNGQHNS